MATTIAIDKVGATSYKLKQDVLFKPLLDGGATEGFITLSNCSNFAIGPSAETTTVQGTQLDNYGQSLDSITQPGDVTISMTFTRQNLYVAVISMLGAGTALDEPTGGTVASEAIPAYAAQVAPVVQQNVDWTTLQFLGAELTVTDATQFTVGELINNTTTPGEVGYVHPSSAGTQLFVILSAAGSLPSNGDGIVGATSAAVDTATVVASDDTIAVATTDYTIKNDRYIAFPETGQWQKGNVQITYAYDAYTGNRVAIGADSIIKGEFVMLATNLVNNQDVEIRLRQANLAPDGEVAYVTDGDDRADVTLTGIAETPEGSADAGTITYLAAA